MRDLGFVGHDVRLGPSVPDTGWELILGLVGGARKMTGKTIIVISCC